jgi:hypothetical protein
VTATEAPWARTAWIFTNGPLPPGTQVAQNCENWACCNPEHLFLMPVPEKVARRNYRRHQKWLRREFGREYVRDFNRQFGEVTR